MWIGVRQRSAITSLKGSAGVTVAGVGLLIYASGAAVGVEIESDAGAGMSLGSAGTATAASSCPRQRF